MDFKKLKQTAIVLFFVMFIYSGINKIFGFDKKVLTLQKKTGLPHVINQFGMIGVILLEIIGSILIILYSLNLLKIPVLSVKLTYFVYLAFLVVVTLLYHPPTQKIIPFLSNLTTFAGLLYLYSDVDYLV
tara:strand:+ start:9596 stop:9985 length:390 start_codon:yes stop_codon:yes gene_type:complete